MESQPQNPEFRIYPFTHVYTKSQGHGSSGSGEDAS